MACIVAEREGVLTLCHVRLQSVRPVRMGCYHRQPREKVICVPQDQSHSWNV